MTTITGIACVALVVILLMPVCIFIVAVVGDLAFHILDWLMSKWFK